MKQLIIFCYSLLFGTNCLAQNLVISTGEIETVYYNFPNPILFNSDCYDPTITLHTENGKIYERDGQWIWIPYQGGGAYIKLIRVTGTDTTAIDSTKFSVKLIDIPRIMTDRKHRHSGLSNWQFSSKLIFDPKLYPHLKLDDQIQILSYDLRVSDSTHKIDTVFRANNEYLPREFLEFRKQHLWSGTKIEITSIRVKCSWLKTESSSDAPNGFDALNPKNLIWTIY